MKGSHCAAACPAVSRRHVPTPLHTSAVIVGLDTMAIEVHALCEVTTLSSPAVTSDRTIGCDPWGLGPQSCLLHHGSVLSV